MHPSKESKIIVSAFSKYARTSDNILIEDIPEGELELALIQYTAFRHLPYYAAMERRLIELKEERKSRRTQKDKWKDRIIGAFFAIVVGLIVAYFKNFLKQG